MTTRRDTTLHKTFVAAFSAAVAVVGSLLVAVTAGSDGGATVTMPEWLQAIWVGLTAGGGAVGVYAIQNHPK